MGPLRALLKYLFVSAAYVGVAAFLARWAGHPYFFRLEPRSLATLSLVYWVCLAAALAAKLLWVHGAWKALPPACRVTALGTRVDPDEAAYMHFVPWKAITWQFTAHVGVAEATRAVLASYDTRATASARLPFLACTTLLIPGVNFVAFPALLYAHMNSLDRAQEEMAGCLASNAHVRPWFPPQRPSSLSWVKPMIAATLLTWLAVPFVFVELMSIAHPVTSSASTGIGPIKTPAHVELHSDRIAEAMTACARVAGNKVPKSFEACPNVKAPLQVAILEGGARYEWEPGAAPDYHGTLIAWWPDVPRVYAKRHLSCSQRSGCEFQREKYGL